ncbi:MAG: hypothetical protein ACRD3C_13985 [Vicinamibacterales bacterium]
MKYSSDDVSPDRQRFLVNTLPEEAEPAPVTAGFPYGHDQWISTAATSWATMALVPAPASPRG